jgi:hypothetical protein
LKTLDDEKDSTPPAPQNPEPEPEVDEEPTEEFEWHPVADTDEPDIEIEAPASKKPVEPAITRRSRKKAD